MKKLLIIILFFPLIANAETSIGLNPSSYNIIDKNLKGGMIYNLSPDLMLFNLLDRNATFEAKLECIVSEDKKTRCPDPNWIILTPSNFSLNSGEGRSVRTTISLPRSAKNGEYFGIISFTLKSFEDQTTQTGASIGVAVGSKVSFEIAGKIPKHKQILNSLNRFFKTNSLAMAGGITNGILTIIIFGIDFLFLVIITFKKKYKISKR